MQVVPVDVDVAVVRARDCVHAQRDPHRLLVRERRDVAEALLLPERERAERRSERDGEGDRLAPPSGEQSRGEDAEEEEQARRLHERREARQEPGEDSRARIAALDCTHREDRRGEEANDRRRVVGHRGQAQRMGEELVDVAVVVAVLEERDGGVGHHRPEEGRGVAHHPAADPRSQLVDAPERDRCEHDHLEDERARQPVNERRAGDERERCEHERPAVRDERHGDDLAPISSQPVVQNQIWSPPW